MAEEDLPLATFHIASDLHLEFGKPCGTTGGTSFPFDMPKPAGPGLHIALLAGDLGHPTKPEYKSLLAATKAKFDHVIAVAGNHEYYAKKKDGQHVNIDEVIAAAHQAAEETGCIFLNRESYTLAIGDEKITILRCTLWSHLEPHEYYKAKQGLNDFRMIYFGHGEFLTPPVYASWHKRDATWLEQEIDARPEENVVVITHHVPSMRVINPIYHSNPLNMCFVTNLEHLFKSQVKLWACGHSHKRGTSQINSSWCGLNPRGYPGENGGFLPLVFSLFKGGRTKLIM